jgi:hypothetical protein
MKTICIVTFFLCFLSVTAQEDPADCEEIVKALNNARIDDLSPYIANTVECDMFGKSNVYSKAQTVQIMKDFFDQNKPRQFSVNHRGGQGQTKFVIGTYLTVTGKKFRISFTVKQQEKKNLIQQIRIENAG